MTVLIVVLLFTLSEFSAAQHFKFSDIRPTVLTWHCLIFTFSGH
jgi:hypothetical protein